MWGDITHTIAREDFTEGKSRVYKIVSSSESLR
jgi:hypothetical protein